MYLVHRLRIRPCAISTHGTCHIWHLQSLRVLHLHQVGAAGIRFQCLHSVPKRNKKTTAHRFRLPIDACPSDVSAVQLVLSYCNVTVM